MLGWLKSEYTRSLEREVERLRAENRALLNSLLGTRGFAPLPGPQPAAATQADEKPVRFIDATPRRNPSSFQWLRRRERQDANKLRAEFDEARAKAVIARKEAELQAELTEKAGANGAGG